MRPCARHGATMRPCVHAPMCSLQGAAPMRSPRGAAPMHSCDHARMRSPQGAAPMLAGRRCMRLWWGLCCCKPHPCLPGIWGAPCPRAGKRCAGYAQTCPRISAAKAAECLGMQWRQDFGAHIEGQAGSNERNEPQPKTNRTILILASSSRRLACAVCATCCE